MATPSDFHLLRTFRSVFDGTIFFQTNSIVTLADALGRQGHRGTSYNFRANHGADAGRENLFLKLCQDFFCCLSHGFIFIR